MVSTPSLGQDTPDHESVLLNWFVSQRAALSGSDTLSFDELAIWTIDAPFGSPTLEMSNNVRQIPFESRAWKRTRSARLNNRPVPPARLDEVKKRWHTNTRKQVTDIINDTTPSPALLQRMTPLSAVSRDNVNGRRTWRVEVVRKDRRIRLERLTFWFDIESEELLRTRAIVSAGNDGPSFVITTDYENVDSFDVPAQRLVEGSVRIKRRSRFFTVLISHVQEFSNFRVD